ncbi:MAG: pentapeptide repeat-containing protein [Gammaproteobacteria bacterium]|nr:pentapeptide repeat-containing protein [Gammaproteobacteria bacterium]
MSENFSGKNLRGRSFKGRDLSCADFSGADLRAANFRDAKLPIADFSGAYMGARPHSRRVLWAGIFLFGIAMGFLLILGPFSLANVIEDWIAKPFRWTRDVQLGLQGALAIYLPLKPCCG